MLAAGGQLLPQARCYREKLVRQAIGMKGVLVSSGYGRGWCMAVRGCTTAVTVASAGRRKIQKAEE